MTLSNMLILVSIIAICIFIAEFFYSRKKERANLSKNRAIFNEHHSNQTNSVKHEIIKPSTNPTTFHENKVNNHIDMENISIKHKNHEIENEIIISNNKIETVSITQPTQQNLSFQFDEINTEPTFPKYNYDHDEQIKEIEEEKKITTSFENTNSSEINLQKEPEQIELPEIEKPKIEPFYSYEPKHKKQNITIDKEKLIKEINKQTNSTFHQDKISVNTDSRVKDDIEIISMFIVPKEKQNYFNGTSIMHIFEELGIYFGKKNIFHRYIDQANTNTSSIFSVANLGENGTFNYINLLDSKIKGLLFFMLTPSNNRIAKTNFRLMLNAAENVAEQLNAVILNSKKQVFSEQDKEEIIKKFENS